MAKERKPVLTGGCQCGAVRYALFSIPSEPSICHCRMCQKAFGNYFAPLAGVPLGDLEWTNGQPGTFHSSELVERGFCRDCGTPLFFRYTVKDRISVSIGSLGHRLISAHPDSCGCEFDECEIVGGVLLVPGRDGSEVLELVEEALDAVPRSVQEGAEGGFVEPAGQRLDVGEDAPCRHVLAEKVAVVGAVGDQDLAGAEALKHVGGAPAVVSLSLGQLQGDRQAVGIDEGVDLGGQPASRAPHAAGVRSVPSRGVLRTPFLPFAPCW